MEPAISGTALKKSSLPRERQAARILRIRLVADNYLIGRYFITVLY